MKRVGWVQVASLCVAPLGCGQTSEPYALVNDAGSAMPPDAASADGGTGCGSAPRSGPIPEAEAGFVEAPGVRLFYSFHAALEQPATAPILVFLNGGATTGILGAYGTGPYVLDAEAAPTEPPRENDAPFTEFANLLFVDPVDYGFTHLTSRVEPNRYCGEIERSKILDAVRALLQGVFGFLDSHALLSDNPVVFVGESFGGAVVTTALYWLHHWRTIRAEDFRLQQKHLTSWLEKRLGEHALVAFPGCEKEADSRRALSKQFARRPLFPAVVDPSN